MIDTLDYKAVKSAVRNGAYNLENKKTQVNNLNVFPVPDGDTGTNMSLTFQYALKEADECSEESAGEVIASLSSGALMGARGNSGVILSQLCRGFASSIREKQTLNISDIAAAFVSASEQAYKAVLKPTEGTILTVARQMAEFARDTYIKYTDIAAFLKDIIKVGYDSLANTPNLLSVLKEAGVVDAGGQGLMFILEGILASLEGGEIILTNETDIKEPMEFVEGIEQDIKYAFCTEFLIRANKKPHAKYPSHQDYLLDKLTRLGDSLLVIEDNGIVKIHVHTNEPWTAMKFAAGCGELVKIKIENMREQHKEMFVKELEDQKEKGKEPLRYAVIAVSSGDGLSQVLKEMGVTHIIEGGQTMNPSTQDFVKVINKVNAENYILLPNNKNIILAAEQAKQISGKPISVIPTKAIPEAISALINFSEEADLAENEESMTQGALGVITAQITYAVRDTTAANKNISKGDILGIISSEIVCAEKTVGEAVKTVIEKIAAGNELITLYYGKDVKKREANKICNELKAEYPDTDIELIDGGQPLYYYIISAE